MSTQNPPADVNWSRTEAVAWMVRAIHNRAIGIYMGDPTEDQYADIYRILRNTLESLGDLIPDVNGWDCEPGWCPDERDRCVPCEGNGNGDD